MPVRGPKESNVLCGLVAADTYRRSRLVGAKVGHRQAPHKKPIPKGVGFFIGRLIGGLLAE